MPADMSEGRAAVAVHAIAIPPVPAAVGAVPTDHKDMDTVMEAVGMVWVTVLTSAEGCWHQEAE